MKHDKDLVDEIRAELDAEMDQYKPGGPLRCNRKC